MTITSLHVRTGRQKPHRCCPHANNVEYVEYVNCRQVYLPKSVPYVTEGDLGPTHTWLLSPVELTFRTVFSIGPADLYGSRL